MFQHRDRAGKFWSLVTFVALAAGCAEPYAPPGLREFTPPSSYTTYWQAIDACSGVPRPMTTRFFTATSLGMSDGEEVGGKYQPSTDRIYILAPFAFDSLAAGGPGMIRHEMLHAHLRAAGLSMGHPAAYFGSPPTWTDGKCGAIVAH